MIKREAAAGVVISRQTVRRYEQQKLISAAKRGSGGRGVGRWTEYDQCVLPEIWAANSLLSGDWVNYINMDVFDSNAKFRPSSISWMRETYLRDGAMWNGVVRDVLDKDKEYLSLCDKLEEIVTVFLSMGLVAVYGVMLEKANRLFKDEGH